MRFDHLIGAISNIQQACKIGIACYNQHTQWNKPSGLIFGYGGGSAKAAGEWGCQGFIMWKCSLTWEAVCVWYTNPAYPRTCLREKTTRAPFPFFGVNRLVSCKLFFSKLTIQVYSNQIIFAGAMLAALNTAWPAVLALFRPLVPPAQAQNDHPDGEN